MISARQLHSLEPVMHNRPDGIPVFDNPGHAYVMTFLSAKATPIAKHIQSQFFVLNLTSPKFLIGAKH